MEDRTGGKRRGNKSSRKAASIFKPLEVGRCEKTTEEVVKGR